MAIKADIEQDMGGGLSFAPTGVYLRAASVSQDRENEAVTVVLTAWDTAERRQAYKDARAAVRAAQAAVVSKNVRWQEVQTGKAQTELVQAQLALASAEAAKQAAGPASFGRQVVFTGSDYTAVVEEDGDVSLTKVYERLMQREEFKNAEAI